MEKDLEKLMSQKLLYSLPVWTHTKEILVQLLKKYTSIQFVSLVGVDLRGNNTDEKIPISILLDDVESFLEVGVQTDGSSVMLHEIATLNNAKVDLVPDVDVNWYVDYNFEHIHKETGLPVGSLRIPAFLRHEGKHVGSRGVLARMEKYFEKRLIEIFAEYPEMLEEYDIKSSEEIDSICMTAATELEFWVRTPQDKADEEKGKIIVKSRIDRAKHTDNKWAVISHISHYNRMLFTYPVLAAMAEAKFNHFETFPNDYIAGFDK